MTRELEIIAPGPFATVQDRGRPGRAAWGVGRSGAADRASAALANRLVANPASAAVLEVTLGALSLRAHAALTMVLTGADAGALVGGRPVAWGAPFPVSAGAILALGSPATGLRTYLGVRGGIDVPLVLGSRSYDVLARLGPPPLAVGDRLPVGPEPHRWPDVDVAPARRGAVAAEPDGAVVLTGWPGPHDDALGADGVVGLRKTLWAVTADSDRTGLRLSGPRIPRPDETEWPVEGLVRGAVQLPPSGRPVVMLADHPVTGGYPAVAVLDQASCDRAAQLRPGERVRLRLSGPRR